MQHTSGWSRRLLIFLIRLFQDSASSFTGSSFCTPSQPIRVALLLSGHTNTTSWSVTRVGGLKSGAHSLYVAERVLFHSCILCWPLDGNQTIHQNSIKLKVQACLSVAAHCSTGCSICTDPEQTVTKKEKEKDFTSFNSKDTGTLTWHHSSQTRAFWVLTMSCGA